MTLAIPLWMIAAHYVCDWKLQSNKMALNKSRSVPWLWYHAAVATSWCALTGNANFWLFNFFAHGVIDAVSSQFTGKLWFLEQRKGFYLHSVPAGVAPDGFLAFRVTDSVPISDPWVGTANTGRKRHWFFNVIGLDQLAHYAVIAVAVWRCL